MGGFSKVVAAGSSGWLGWTRLTGVVCPLGRGLASLRCLLMRVRLGGGRFLGWLGGGARPGPAAAEASAQGGGDEWLLKR